MEAGIKQLFTITGARGTGKTTLAATYLPPSQLEKVVYFDAEKSANSFRANLKRLQHPDFGLYIDLQERFTVLPKDDDLLDRINKGEPPWATSGERNALIGYYQHIISELAALPRDKYTVLVIDTAEKLEAGMAAYVEANKSKFGVTTMAYGKLWSEGVFPLYQNIFQGIWQRGIDTIILNFHLKNVWEGSRPVPGKVAMSGKKILYTLSSLMLWLVNDSRNARGEPAGLVIKERLGQLFIENDTWQMQQMLPPRIPTCTWHEIDKYLDGRNRYDIANPKPTEMRSQFEDDMISDLYSDAQLALMMTDAKIEEQKNSLAMAEAGLVNTTFASTTTTLDFGAQAVAINDNKPPANRAEALRAWTGMGRKVPDLLPKLAGLTDEQIAEQWQEIAED